MSSLEGTSVWLSMSTAGASFRETLVEVLERTLGHEGAFVSAPSSSRSSSTDDLLSLAAAVRLQRVMENPGPFREVSNVPEYIFVGFIFQFCSRGISIAALRSLLRVDSPNCTSVSCVSTPSSRFESPP